MSILPILCDVSEAKFHCLDYGAALVEFLKDELTYRGSSKITNCLGFFCIVDPEEF